MIILAIAAILAVGAYSFLDVSEMEAAKSGISATHDKIISHGESSKSDGSKSGSQSSRSSNSNSKPNAKSYAASKGVISSNPNLNGAGGDDPDRNDDDGDKRDRKLKKGQSTSGGSTDNDSSEESSEVEEEDNEIYWIDTKMEHGPSTPLVGDQRRPRIWSMHQNINL